MIPPDPNVTPAPPTRGWKGGPWPALAAALVLIGAYAALALGHARLAPQEAQPTVTASRTAE